MSDLEILHADEELAPGNYPRLSLRPPSTPNRFWALPVLGIVIKSIILIPIFIWIGILGTVLLIASLMNSLSVLFAGQYWPPAYAIALGLIRLTAKTDFFLIGLTDAYPGIGLTLPRDATFTVEVGMPGSPSRAFAIPIFGGLARGILLIPYVVWQEIVQSASLIAAVVASPPVLFTGRYPSACVEMVRDATRVQLGALCYGLGLSDAYPSFAISMKNAAAKWAFIILGAALALMQFFNNNRLPEGGG